MDPKQAFLPTVNRLHTTSRNAWLFVIVLTTFSLALAFWHKDLHHVLPHWTEEKDASVGPAALVRSYHLQTGVRWMNPGSDGGRWRVMFTCNGQSPCPTLYAEEGDIIDLSVKSDIYAQSSIHLSGIGHKQTLGPWNDGTAGLSQFPTLPRSNWSTAYDTSGAWGLNWFIDHTTTASADGIAGAIYVAPSPDRPRPYHLITNDSLDIRQIREAERAIRHVIIQNHQHRDTVWKLLRMRVEGSEYYCYDSILVNGKGRVHCRQPGYDYINGHALDQKGCIQPPGLPDETCTPSEADYEVIETQGQKYLMLNLINLGFEHSVKVSIDHHKMTLVANNGGFVFPESSDVVYIPDPSRVTVLVHLDAEPDDYAIRISSTSELQNLHGYAILRYRAKRPPQYGEPMTLPPTKPEAICLFPDGNTHPDCSTTDAQFVPPYPENPPLSVTKHRPAQADLTFRLTADSQSSKTERVPEYFLNGKPLQLFHGSMLPLLFHAANETLEKPVISNLPLGSVVDLIIENRINETISFYKHGEPSWLLGSGANERFPGETVEDVMQRPGVSEKVLNLHNPGLVIVHDLPALGWSVLRFKVTSQTATMLHAAKLRYFALGMTVPILEGITVDTPLKVPESVVDRPHVDFKPAHDGIFG
ncbi:hypothetical protein HG531_001328 [Fusarium graminearum]|nr:hypothetical protein HG531_001328 [Fusarium graminearum]